VSERDDDRYLLDPGAPEGDADVQALERALSPLRRRGGPAPERVLAAPLASRPSASARWRWPLAGLVAAAACWWLLLWLGAGDGAMRGGSLREGAASRTFVAAKQPLVVPLGERASVTLQPGSELEFVHWRADEARLRLRRGALLAEVQPPPAVAPAWFVVETPRGVVVDRGCRFELTVRGQRAKAESVVRVLEGAVTFGDGGREVFVPAGATARLTPDGVGTPTFVDAPRDLKQLARMYDEALRERDRDRRAEVARKLAFTCNQPPDTLALWHLTSDDDYEVRKIATDALFQIVGAPDGARDLLRVYTADEWLPHLRVTAWSLGR